MARKTLSLAAGAALATAALGGCYPGTLDRTKFPCAGEADCPRPDGGSPPPEPPPAACERLAIRSTAEAETKLVLPRCGAGPAGAFCHATFLPTALSRPDMLRSGLLDRRSNICPNDNLIDTRNRARSVLLAKVNAPGPVKLMEATCSDGRPAGARMPYEGGAVPAAPFSADELACFTWYVNFVER